MQYAAMMAWRIDHQNLPWFESRMGIRKNTEMLL
jgi:hypothetical protein